MHPRPRSRAASAACLRVKATGPAPGRQLPSQHKARHHLSAAAFRSVPFRSSTRLSRLRSTARSAAAVNGSVPNKNTLAAWAIRSSQGPFGVVFFFEVSCVAVAVELAGSLPCRFRRRHTLPGPFLVPSLLIHGPRGTWTWQAPSIILIHEPDGALAYTAS